MSVDKQSFEQSPVELSISMVTYKNDPEVLESALRSLCASILYAKQTMPWLKAKIYMVENDDDRSNLKQVESVLSDAATTCFDDVKLIVSDVNVGYGRGHNLALFEVSSDYHLVLNPDVLMAEDAILHALEYLQNNQGVALISPFAVNGKGGREYLCKRYPKVLDLCLRGFAPEAVQNFFSPRLQRYEMRDLTDGNQPKQGVELVSGCCMVLRTAPLKQIGGFSDRFFLYFEDFDLSIRLRRIAEVAYIPQMKIEHYGGYTTKKGLWHIMLFISSAIKFFSQHGWRWV